MKPIEATRRGVLAMGLSVGAAPLLPAAASEPAKPERASAPDFSTCRDGIAVVIAATAHHFGIAEPVLCSRERSVARARHMSMYLAWLMTGRSLCEISRRYELADHTTVLQAGCRMSMRAAEDPAVNDDLEAIAALCVVPLRSRGVKLTAIPISSDWAALRFSLPYEAVWSE